MDIWGLLQDSIIFFLPAYFANAMPVVAARYKMFPNLASPIHKSIFGKSKTYRGFFVGTLGALTIGIVQVLFGYYNNYGNDAFIMFFWISLTLGVGALLGDLCKSFIKRRLGIKSGRPWPVFDQIDYVIGALLLSSIVVPQKTEVIITLLIISPLFSFITNIISYKLGIKKVWW